jgi:hypothetical protein
MAHDCDDWWPVAHLSGVALGLQPETVDEAQELGLFFVDGVAAGVQHLPPDFGLGGAQQVGDEDWRGGQFGFYGLHLDAERVGG